MSDHVLVRRCRRRVVVATALVGVLCAGLGVAPVAGATSAHGEIALTTAGMSTWTAPDGVTTVEVAAWGGGGGGGEGDWINGGGGGGGGGLDKTYIDVTPAATYTVIVGQGGARGEMQFGDGQVGGDSFVTDPSSTRLIVGHGGAGGLGGSRWAPGAGGTGGGGDSTNPDSIALSGRDGGAGGFLLGGWGGDAASLPVFVPGPAGSGGSGGSGTFRAGYAGQDGVVILKW